MTKFKNTTNIIVLRLIAICAIFFITANTVLAAPIVQDPSLLTTRVNKQVGIGNYTPTDLVSLSTLTRGSGFQIRKVVVDDLEELMHDMEKAGVPVKINSAYRSFADQEKVYKISPSIAAKPGFSEHQLGLAVDFGAVNASSGFANTKQFAWLAENGYRYGFALTYPSGQESITGYTYEPWHWRYIGRPTAYEWKHSGLVLDQFLALKPQSYTNSSLIGSNVKAEGSLTVYHISPNGTKRGFIASNAFLSYGYSWDDILVVSNSQLENFPETKMVKLQGNPTVYRFNSDKTRQAVASAETFKNLNYAWADIVEINSVELSGYTEGPIIK